MRNLILTALFGAALAVVPAHAEIVIKLRPPISIREHRAPRPSRNHVWVSGYHRWDGNAYSWQAGRWEQPPRARARWVAPRYTHRRDGYVYTEGHWR
jgi:hypothetical protein